MIKIKTWFQNFFNNRCFRSANLIKERALTMFKSWGRWASVLKTNYQLFKNTVSVRSYPDFDGVVFVIVSQATRLPRCLGSVTASWSTPPGRRLSSGRWQTLCLSPTCSGRTFPMYSLVKPRTITYQCPPQQRSLLTSNVSSVLKGHSHLNFTSLHTSQNAIWKG